MTRNAKPGLPRAVDGAMGAPQRFWGGSVIYNGKKVKIALYLAVFVTRDREGYVDTCGKDETFMSGFAHRSVTHR